MRYLSLAEALAKTSRLELLDSALHAPQAGFGEEDFYRDRAEGCRPRRPHRAEPSLPDGIKRLAWQSLTKFLALNGYDLATSPEDAAEIWIRERVEATG